MQGWDIAEQSANGETVPRGAVGRAVAPPSLKIAKPPRPMEYDTKTTNDAGEPYCDNCGMLHGCTEVMTEVGDGDEWLCPSCHNQLQTEIEQIKAQF